MKVMSEMVSIQNFKPFFVNHVIKNPTKRFNIVDDNERTVEGRVKDLCNLRFFWLNQFMLDDLHGLFLTQVFLRRENGFDAILSVRWI